MLHFGAFSQDPMSDLLQHRPADKNLTAPVIRDLKVNDPVEYEKQKFYYTGSFEVEDLTCNSCEVDYFDLFNLSLFDVSKFEEQRQHYDKVEFDFKGRYRITLHSRKELLWKYSEIEGSMAAERSLALPELDLSKLDVDAAYEAYKVDLNAFRMSNGSYYSELYNDKSVIKISFEELKLYSESRRESVLINAKGYIITDESYNGLLRGEEQGNSLIEKKL